METNNSNLFAKAIIEARAKIKPIPKTKEAIVKSERTGSQYTYKYADLSDILDAVIPVLREHNLTVMQPSTCKDGKCTIHTRLIHESGEVYQTDFEFQADTDARRFGASLTYFRRYALTSFLGIMAEDDTDGEDAVVKFMTRDRVNEIINFCKKNNITSESLKSFVNKTLSSEDMMSLDETKFNKLWVFLKQSARVQ